MNCRKCKKELPDGAPYCCWCGVKQDAPPRRRRRSNGEGYVYKRGAKWACRYRKVVGEQMIDRYKGNFPTRAAAQEWLAHINDVPRTDPTVTFAALYEKWIQRHSSRVGASTIACYKAAYKYFEALYPCRFALLTTEQLQACVDNCPHGVRTRENMKALCTCLYKYAREIGVCEMDYGQFIYIVRDTQPTEKRAFTRAELNRLIELEPTTPDLDLVLILCFTGFRINELVAMNRESFDPTERTLTGGSKTKAGMNRVVPVSPVIEPFVRRHYDAAAPGGPLFSVNGKRWTTNHLRDALNRALTACEGVRALLPHECRHTFASLLKSAAGAREDKKRLIGHSSDEMLEHYTHAEIGELRAIIDQL